MRSILVFLLASGCVSAADDVLVRVTAHADRFGAVSRQISETPELGYHETKSSALLQQELRANGFDVKSGVAGMPTAFTASSGSRQGSISKTYLAGVGPRAFRRIANRRSITR
jgi:aminobenzoyl-glutamate utilization protein B